MMHAQPHRPTSRPVAPMSSAVPVISVVGVGGAGGNAVNNMIASGLEGVNFMVCNTDAQALASSLCETRVQLGDHVRPFPARNGEGHYS